MLLSGSGFPDGKLENSLLPMTELTKLGVLVDSVPIKEEADEGMSPPSVESEVGILSAIMVVREVSDDAICDSSSLIAVVGLESEAETTLTVMVGSTDEALLPLERFTLAVVNMLILLDPKTDEESMSLLDGAEDDSGFWDTNVEGTVLG